MQKIKSWGSNWPLVLLFITTFLITWPLFQHGYFSHHDDLQVMRIFEMRKCIEDLQIPCRWVPDMGYGNGYPMFNYYGVFPYYIGAIISYVFGFIGAAKALFFLTLFVGTFGMYFLAKELFGEKIGFLAAIIFQFAPYRALDSYVRGDIDETLAISLIPICCYFSLKLVKKKNLSDFIWMVVSFAIFFTTHNIMIMLVTPFFLLWILFWLWKEKWKGLLRVILGLLLSFGLASFFLIPAFFEKGLVQTESLISLDLNFRAHFVTVGQLLFDRSWGYGASVPGTADTISFQIGWPLWWLVIISVFFVGFKTLQEKKKNFFFFFLLLVFGFAIFMTHNKSAIIWEQIQLLAYTQFPWRFLAIAIFTGSLLSVWWLQYLPNKFQTGAIAVICALIIFFNLQYFVPERFYENMTDQEKLSGIEWETQQKAAILDYLPKGANKPVERAPEAPMIIRGSGEISNFKNYTDHFEFDVKTYDQSLIEIPILDFPNWTTFVNGVKIDHSSENYLRRINITLGQGEYKITGELKNTPIRYFANIVTIFSFLLLLIIIKNEKVKGFLKKQ